MHKTCIRFLSSKTRVTFSSRKRCVQFLSSKTRIKCAWEILCEFHGYFLQIYSCFTWRKLYAHFILFYADFMYVLPKNAYYYIIYILWFYASLFSADSMQILWMFYARYFSQAHFTWQKLYSSLCAFVDSAWKDWETGTRGSNSEEIEKQKKMGADAVGR